MFWKFGFHTQSAVDLILERDAYTLEELLDQDEILQDTRSANQRLIDFLTQPDTMESLLRYAILLPDESADEKERFKYPNIAAEILSSEVPAICNVMCMNEKLVEMLWGFLDQEGELNPLMASFFSKIIGLLIHMKRDETFGYLREKPELLEKFLVRLGTPAIMDILMKIVATQEEPEGADMLQWLVEQRLPERLIARFAASEPDTVNQNAAQALAEIVIICNDAANPDDPEPNPMVSAIEDPVNIMRLMEHMFDSNPSGLSSGCALLLSLLSDPVVEVPMEDEEDGPPQQPRKRISLVNKSLVVRTVTTRLADFHAVLAHPPHAEPFATTTGVLEQPFGQLRLRVLRLLAAVIHANVAEANEIVANEKMLDTILDLFFAYPWNNFLHSVVEDVITTIVQTHIQATAWAALAQTEAAEAAAHEAAVIAADEEAAAAAAAAEEAAEVEVTGASEHEDEEDEDEEKGGAEGEEEEAKADDEAGDNDKDASEDVDTSDNNNEVAADMTDQGSSEEKKQPAEKAKTYADVAQSQGTADMETEDATNAIVAAANVVEADDDDTSADNDNNNDDEENMGPPTTYLGAPLMTILFQQCQLTERIVRASLANDEYSGKIHGQRLGFMGHLTRIANVIVEATKEDEIRDVAGSFSDDWDKFTKSSLVEANTRNSQMLGGHRPLNCSDESDEEFFEGMDNQPTPAELVFTDYLNSRMQPNMPDDFGIDEDSQQMVPGMFSMNPVALGGSGGAFSIGSDFGNLRRSSADESGDSPYWPTDGDAQRDSMDTSFGFGNDSQGGQSAWGFPTQSKEASGWVADFASASAMDTSGEGNVAAFRFVDDDDEDDDSNQNTTNEDDEVLDVEVEDPLASATTTNDDHSDDAATTDAVVEEAVKEVASMDVDDEEAGQQPPPPPTTLPPGATSVPLVKEMDVDDEDVAQQAPPPPSTLPPGASSDSSQQARSASAAVQRRDTSRPAGPKRRPPTKRHNQQQQQEGDDEDSSTTATEEAAEEDAQEEPEAAAASAPDASASAEEKAVQEAPSPAQDAPSATQEAPATVAGFIGIEVEEEGDTEC